MKVFDSFMVTNLFTKNAHIKAGWQEHRWIRVNDKSLDLQENRKRTLWQYVSDINLSKTEIFTMLEKEKWFAFTLKTLLIIFKYFIDAAKDNIYGEIFFAVL